MGLEVPELDDRSFEELLTDARKRIPVHSDSWTDHNRSDPGITILELLAWVAESDLYQLDRVTDRHVRKYLRLLGVRPRAPQQATVPLNVEPPSAAAGARLPEKTRLSVDDAGTTRRFETEQRHVLTDADVAAVVSETPSGRVDHSRANATDGLYFRAFGEAAAKDSAVYIGFDADPFRGGDRLDLYVDFHEADLPAPAGEAADPPFEPSVRVVWEHCTDPERFRNAAAWERMDDPDDSSDAGEEPGDGDDDGGADPNRTGFEDGTNHLYKGGTVSTPEPDAWTGVAHTPFEFEEPYVWLRARVAVPGHEVPPQLNGFETGVVEAVHRARYYDERLVRAPEGLSAEVVRQQLDDVGSEGEPTTTAQPDQEFVFPRAPVLDAEVSVGGTTWNQVEDFDTSAPDGTDYVLDRERAVARFGDGVRGEIPAPDQPVRATWYHHGGGEAGNVNADANWQLDDASASPWPDDQPPSGWPADLSPAAVGVRARRPGTGGADAESTVAALARLKADLRRPYRAVTEDDYRYLATHTPGLRFGRAAVHVETPDEAGEGCAETGSVTVVVVPYSPPSRDRPMPSDGFLEAVARHLRRHSLLTDELVVEAPVYVGVRVRTDVGVADGYAADPTAEAVEEAVARFLDPLEGFDGEGWPFGRPVYRSEVYETIEHVDGVDCVNDVDLAAGEAGTRATTGIDLPPTGLAYLAEASVTAGAAGDHSRRWSR